MPSIVFADASFDVKTRISVLGVCDEFYGSSHTKSVRVKDNNEAELAAVNLAASLFPETTVIFTDSEYAIKSFSGKHSVQKCQRNNVANILVRSKREEKHQ